MYLTHENNFLCLNQTLQYQKTLIICYLSVLSIRRDIIGLIPNALDANVWRWLEYPNQYLQTNQEVRFQHFGESRGRNTEKDIDSCQRAGNQDRSIVKFLVRKDYQQVVNARKDIQKITAANLDLPNSIKIYRNEILALTKEFAGRNAKPCTMQVKLKAISLQMVQLS